MKETKKISLTTYILSLIMIAIITAIAVAVILKTGKNDNIANNTNKSVVNNSISENSIKESKAEDDFFVIYNGLEITKKAGVRYARNMEINEPNKEKYNIIYYNYEKGEYKGETKGVFGKEEPYEGESYVENVSKIAISKKYNAIPRKFRNWSKEEVEKHQEIKNYEKVNIQEIDLDGDNKLEYIVNVQEDIKEGDFDDKSATMDANSYITIYDSEFNKIADLVKLEHAFSTGEKKEANKVFWSLDEVEYIDLDNDGKMEILIHLPSWEGFNYSLLKYDNGKIEGKTDYEATLKP